jgi:hypothetical protein
VWSSVRRARVVGEVLAGREVRARGMEVRGGAGVDIVVADGGRLSTDGEVEKKEFGLVGFGDGGSERFEGEEDENGYL